MELPLFPLHSVLCPGVALPLHIFEERYRLMIARSVERSEPFGVVLIREGRETGTLQGRLAAVGTTAMITEVDRHADGRLDIMTVGGRRFRIKELDTETQPYLVAEVELIEERLGDEMTARYLAQRVSRRFLQYLELLQPALEAEDGDEVTVEIEIASIDDPSDDPGAEEMGTEDEATVLEVIVEQEPPSPEEAAETEVPFGGSGREDELAAAMERATEDERHELLMAAARRLAVPDDPMALSYILGGLVQVELPTRQSLLEAEDTESRLRELDSLLGREIQLLERRLKPLLIDPKLAYARRN